MLRVVRRHLASVDSTNTYAKSNVGEFDSAAITVVSADEQTAGRGRGDRVWKSGSGALDITVTFAFPIPREAMPHAYQLSPLIAVCFARVLRERFGVDASIKWPNDLIYAGRSKFGGVLCELEAPRGGGPYWACLGVGVNVNSAPAALGVSRPAWPLTTLSAELGRTLDVAEVTDAVIAAFAEVGKLLLASPTQAPRCPTATPLLAQCPRRSQSFFGPALAAASPPFRPSTRR